LVDQATIVTPNLTTLVLTYEDFEHRDYLGNFRRRQATDRLFGMNRSVVKKLEEDCTAKGIDLDVLYN